MKRTLTLVDFLDVETHLSHKTPDTQERKKSLQKTQKIKGETNKQTKKPKERGKIKTPQSPVTGDQCMGKKCLQHLIWRRSCRQNASCCFYSPDGIRKTTLTEVRVCMYNKFFFSFMHMQYLPLLSSCLQTSDTTAVIKDTMKNTGKVSMLQRISESIRQNTHVQYICTLVIVVHCF